MIIVKNLQITVTDVLRVAVYLSGGDVSLPKVPQKSVKAGRWSSAKIANPAREAFKFKKFNRQERKYLLGLLEKTHCNAAEAVLKDERWKRLGEILHPGEYANKYPKASAMFEKIRNEKIQSWYGEVDAAFGKSFRAGLKKLSERPGELARRLDWLARQSTNNKLITQTFVEVGNKVSNKVLFELYTHLSKRSEPTTNRSIMVKGARKRTKLPELPALSKNVISGYQNAVKSILGNKFSELPSLGKVYLDEELKNIPLPTNMRSVSASLKPIVRGVHLKWDNPEAKVIRAFLHFSKQRTGCTIDLSAIIYGERNSTVIDWSHQKPLGEGAHHSGDSYGRVGDCAEYVDLDIESLVSQGFTYVLIQLNNYNNSKELYENNYFGIMERTEPESNALWLPKTISNCFNIKIENKVNCAIIDLKNKSFIMIDEDAGSSGHLQNASVKDIEKLKDYFNPPAFSVYDLLKIHVDNRGELVDNEEDADTKFKYEDFSVSYLKTLEYMGI